MYNWILSVKGIGGYDWDVDHFMYSGQRLLEGDFHWTVEFDDKLPVVQILFLLPGLYENALVWLLLSTGFVVFGAWACFDLVDTILSDSPFILLAERKIAASVALVTAISVSEPVFAQAKKDAIEVRNHVKGKFIIKKDSVEKFINLKGTVKDNYGNLPGVSIVLKNTNIGTETDFDGNFSIKIPNTKQKSVILVFSYLGFKTQEVDVLKIKKPLVIEMLEDPSQLGEVITVGYVSVHKTPNVFRWIGNLFRSKENKK